MVAQKTRHASQQASISTLSLQAVWGLMQLAVGELTTVLAKQQLKILRDLGLDDSDIKLIATLKIKEYATLKVAKG